MTNPILKGEPRKIVGRKVKKLRGEGLIPANIFGKKIKSHSVSVDAKEFEKIFKSAGETSLLELQLGKDKRAVLIRNVQRNPVGENILHIDFQQVDLKEKITADIPVEIIGESPAEKQGLGTMVQQVDEIEAEALPADLPDKFEIDVSALTEVDQAIYIKDIKVNKSKVTITDDPEKIVVKIEPPTAVEEPEVVAPAAEGEVPVEGGEVPVSGEENKEEGQKPAEDKAK